MSNYNDSLKFVYENIRVEDKLYDSYEEFMKDLNEHFNEKDHKSIKQIYIIKECIEYAQSMIQEFREKVEKEIEDNSKQDNPKRRKI